jgi:hypothetical protein
VTKICGSVRERSGYVEGMGAYVEQECDRPDECELSHGIALELRGFGLPRTRKLQMQLSRGQEGEYLSALLVWNRNPNFFETCLCIQVVQHG